MKRSTSKYYYYLSLQKEQTPASPNDYLYKLVLLNGGMTKTVTADRTCSNAAFNNNLFGCMADGSVYTSTVISLGEIETILGTNRIGPAGSGIRLNDYQVGNYNHNPKFDPYCAVDKPVSCDTNLDGKYSILDSPKATDTISEPVIWYNTGDPNSLLHKRMFDKINGTCPGAIGKDLASCLAGMDYDKNFTPDIQELNGKFNLWFACASGNPITYVDINAVSDPVGIYTAGGDCEKPGVSGEVKLLTIIERENAYDIDRPKTLMRLLSVATSVVGTGIKIDPLDAHFKFSEALPLVLSRVYMPTDLKVYDGKVLQTNVRVYFQTIRTFSNNNEAPVSGLLRSFLEKLGGFK